MKKSMSIAEASKKEKNDNQLHLNTINESHKTISERVNAILLKMAQKEGVSLVTFAYVTQGFSEWHNGSGWSGDWENGFIEPDFKERP